MTAIPSKRGYILAAFLVLAVVTHCGGTDWRGKKTEGNTSLAAIPYHSGQIKLTWTKSVSNEKGFKIERTTDPIHGDWLEISTVGADLSSYIDNFKAVPVSDLHETNFYYRVLAYGGAQDEKYSNVAAAKLPPTYMAAIPAGCFDMGDSLAEGASDEIPVHKVCLPAFYMDVHEVTNAEFARCIEAGGCKWYTFPNGSDYFGNKKYDVYPVIVSVWEEAKDYCAWSGKRLPTEAEWEYAARGGLSAKRYPRGDSIMCSDANYGRRVPFIKCLDMEDKPIQCPTFNYERQGSPCVDFGGLENREQKVGSYPANGYGLYDMDGNVREWVNDYYSADYYSGRSNPDNDPPGPGQDEAKNIIYHVVRGGCWASVSPLLLRVSFRDTASVFPYDEIGFRCAADPTTDGE